MCIIWSHSNDAFTLLWTLGAHHFPIYMPDDGCNLRLRERIDLPRMTRTPGSIFQTELTAAPRRPMYVANMDAGISSFGDRVSITESSRCFIYAFLYPERSDIEKRAHVKVNPDLPRLWECISFGQRLPAANLFIPKMLPIHNTTIA